MRVGSGKCELVFPDGFLPTEGFTVQAHPLFVRALVIGANKPFVLVSVEMTSLPNDETQALREIAARCAATRPESAWVTVTHTFSAPHILPDEALQTEEDREKRSLLRAMLADAVHTAVLQARNSAEDVDLTFREGMSAVPRSRDVELPEGWWVGCDGDGAANPAMTLLQFGAARPVALLLHLNMQPSVLDGTGAADGKCVSGDVAGIVSAYFERRYPGAVCLFLLGAAGDQAPVQRAKGLCRDENGKWQDIDLRESAISLAERIGVRLIQEARELTLRPGEPISGDIVLAQASVAVPAKKMNRNLRELKPIRHCEWTPDGEDQQPIAILRLGSLAIVGVRPELTLETDRAIRAGSPFPHTLAATLVNGSAKYMAARSCYDRCMYEAINSPFAAGAAETLADAAIDALKGAYS